ncbi:hypothetical protein CQW49_08320 [Methylosinus trichosporium OB3b]|uniref:Uncharacterized protein n=1 Tax=Methylosinus trichosporium (strain ATCC 35070 / NCIMB 11131 / UNIQEM 75 / OB3b) TaxID=595536 RepID=A0A2D2CYR8_METT3|nr:hypothetical protein CQW49_08320 [Methylosinus trichosporium OB3b]OBS51279.1 hypothetical protein A8B73_17180 [Methylosinus sp. 3S-1]
MSATVEDTAGPPSEALAGAVATSMRCPRAREICCGGCGAGRRAIARRCEALCGTAWRCATLGVSRGASMATAGRVVTLDCAPAGVMAPATSRAAKLAIVEPIARRCANAQNRALDARSMKVGIMIPISKGR